MTSGLRVKDKRNFKKQEVGMKTSSYMLVLAAMVLACSACAENKTRIGEGAGFGGILGAAAGGIIGHQSGHGVEGALIGGAVGAASGAAVGSQIEKPQAAVQNQAVAQNYAVAPLTMQQVVDLSKQGVSGDDIIAKIQASGAKFVLTADDVSYLQKQGVSQRVIEAMQAAK